MAKQRTNSAVMGKLARLSAALEANAAELVHMEGPRVRLGSILGEAEEVARQQAALTASKQEASKRFEFLLTEAQRLTTGIIRFLQQHYGTRSEKLAEFGLQPFRGRKSRTAKPAPEPTAPIPPAAPSAADDNHDQ